MGVRVTLVNWRTVRVWGEHFTAVGVALLLFTACGGRSLKNGAERGSGGSGVTQGGADGFLPMTGGSFGSGGSSISTGGTSTGGCVGSAGGSGGSAASYAVVDCGAGQPSTRISGMVRDPAGRVPLYNVVVYVPGAPLPPLSEGATCNRCFDWASAQPIAAALTDVYGQYVLENAPAGLNVPLVFQIGKWRREIVLPEVTACAETVIQADHLSRLPRSQAEGHLPRFAVTTGVDDSMECFLRRIGIATEEFSTDAGAGRVHLFAGCDAGFGSGRTMFEAGLGGEPFSPAAELWGNLDKLQAYDAVLMGCEGGECSAARDAGVANIQTYAETGGRVFFDHHQRHWLKGVGSWTNQVTTLPSVISPSHEARVNTSFPKGSAFGEWLVAAAASSNVGRLWLYDAELSAGKVLPPSVSWLLDNQYDDWLAPALTFDTPVGVSEAEQCGRVTVVDFHVSSAVQPDAMTMDFPTGCVDAALSPQEVALEFLLFDQASCVEDGRYPPLQPGGCGP